MSFNWILLAVQVSVSQYKVNDGQRKIKTLEENEGNALLKIDGKILFKFVNVKYDVDVDVFSIPYVMGFKMGLAQILTL